MYMSMIRLLKKLERRKKHMNEKIALIFTHRGNDFYLNYVLRQARYFNLDADIYLLGDETNRHYDFVTHVMISDYMSSANEFEKVYEHMSSNLYEYELFCFQRWFIILDFVRNNGIENFVCLDSDVLLYCDMNSELSRYIGKYDFTICNGYHPGFNLFNIESLSKFCHYMKMLYIEPSSSYKLKERYQSFILEKKPGGNCDMTAIEYYVKEYPNAVLDIAIPKEHICFDGGISGSFDLFEMDNGAKKIYWQQNIPYFRLLKDGSYVRVGGLHLDGRQKFTIYKYALDKNGRHREDFIYCLLRKLSWGLIRGKIKRYKRGFLKLLQGNIVNFK